MTENSESKINWIWLAQSKFGRQRWFLKFKKLLFDNDFDFETSWYETWKFIFCIDR